MKYSCSKCGRQSSVVNIKDNCPFCNPSTLSRREALLEVKYKLEDALETINRFLKE